MPFDLLIIDPQNDFLDIPGAALPVTGANADMDRLAHWLGQHLDEVDSITVTLDSHASVGIERTSFWQTDDGSPVGPFTVITAADLQAGRFKPRHGGREAEVLTYLQALETNAKRQLVVWPVHCVVGTWGHNIHSALSDAFAQWEAQTGKICEKVLKGQNPMTEQYSAFKAEVPRADDPSTALRLELMDRLNTGVNTLLVAGEASSHCVAASVEDMLANLSPERLQQMVLLTDCMSPVGGFGESADAMVKRAQGQGVAARELVALGVSSGQ
ncbi:MAG: cysteine hydrolase [Rhodoferax sp.]|nr:cysteine hydrolase [Rhodoferax sp.]